MTRSEFSGYHDFAAELERRGTGIGFAGVGAKIRKCAETGRPVPLTIIAAEIGTKRAVVKRSSLLSALYSNPGVRYLGGELFVPAGEVIGGEVKLMGGFGESEGLSDASSAYYSKSIARSGNESTTGGQNDGELQDQAAASGEDVPQISSAYLVDSLDRALREFERRKTPRGPKKRGPR